MGKYIAIEGIDGSGKTTLISKLEKLLTDGGWSVLCVKEPWRFRVNNSSQAVKKDASSFLQDRVRLHERLRSLIEHFDVILSDRCFMSTMVYNSTEELSMDEIIIDHHQCLFPDKIIWLDVDPVKALTRDRAETCLANLEKLSRRYATAAAKLGERVTEIDTSEFASQEDLVQDLFDREINF